MVLASEYVERNGYIYRVHWDPFTDKKYLILVCKRGAPPPWNDKYKNENILKKWM